MVMDEVRVQFSEARQQSDHEEFGVTLSCGIAGLIDGDDASTINDAADKALYMAKDTGRNRVELAERETRSTE